jgi:hypothetical protein
MARMVSIGIFFFVLFSMLVPVETMAVREIPDDNLAYPILINLASCTGNREGTGSGFFLNTETATYLVTARHVLFGDFKGEYKPDRKPICKQAILISYSRDPKEKGQNIFVLDLAALYTNGNIKVHTTHDVALVHIADPKNFNGKTSLSLVPGVRGVQSFPSGILGVEIQTVKKFDEVLTANEVYVFGYPTSVGIQEIPQIDYTKPLIRKGIIAGTNEEKKTIILDCFIFLGNSGGPVLETEWVEFGTKKFRIIGVISEFVPITETWLNERFKYRNTQMHNSGYAVAIPMDMVLELTDPPPAP